jgi:hypothetical protein
VTIDWEALAERVPAGTRVHCLPSHEEGLFGKTEWGGILLDNRLCAEERVCRTRNTQSLREDYEREEAHPVLRVQDFEVADSGDWYFDPLWESVRFFLGSQWLTFDQVMAMEVQS